MTGRPQRQTPSCGPFRGPRRRLSVPATSGQSLPVCACLEQKLGAYLRRCYCGPSTAAHEGPSFSVP